MKRKWCYQYSKVGDPILRSPTKVNTWHLYTNKISSARAPLKKLQQHAEKKNKTKQQNWEWQHKMGEKNSSILSVPSHPPGQDFLLQWGNSPVQELFSLGKEEWSEWAVSPAIKSTSQSIRFGFIPPKAETDREYQEQRGGYQCQSCRVRVTGFPRTCSEDNPSSFHYWRSTASRASRATTDPLEISSSLALSYHWHRYTATLTCS